MAKRSKGILGTVGGIWRFTIFGLALVLLFAIYLNMTGNVGNDIAVDIPASSDDESDSIVQNDSASVQEGADNSRESLETTAGDLSSDSSGESGINSGGSAPSENVADDAAELDDEPGRGERPFAELIVPDDDATYELLNAFQRDDGAIEFTTERVSKDGTTQVVTRLVTCAPFAVGVISSGDGVRNDQPEMERIALGSPEATIAAAVCGAFR